MALVALGVDEWCQTVFLKTRSSRVEIETADGRVLKHFAPVSHCDPDGPLADVELADK
jgi:hypothetical protein